MQDTQKLYSVTMQVAVSVYADSHADAIQDIQREISRQLCDVYGLESRDVQFYSANAEETEE